MKIYELILDSEYDGVNLISVVTAPAIEQDFLKFSAEENIFAKFSKLNEDRQELYGPLLIPGILIYRYSPDAGEYYVRFSADTIRQLEERFFENGFNNSASLEHATPIAGTLFESFILDKKNGLCPKEFEDLPDGTWLGRMKIHDKKTWEQIKTEGYTGFSVEVLAHTVEVPQEEFSEQSGNWLDDILNGKF